VYKWSWDQQQKRKKIDELTESQKEIHAKQQCTDEFGGYSKSWLSNGVSSASTLQVSED
jgi:hypothetical protein